MEEYWKWREVPILTLLSNRAEQPRLGQQWRIYAKGCQSAPCLIYGTGSISSMGQYMAIGRYMAICRYRAICQYRAVCGSVYCKGLELCPVAQAVVRYAKQKNNLGIQTGGGTLALYSTSRFG